MCRCNIIVIFDYRSLNKSLMAAFILPLGKSIILQRIKNEIVKHRFGFYYTSITDIV